MPLRCTGGETERYPNQSPEIQKQATERLIAMVATISCPPRNTLLEFATGNLADNEIESVADHLESCETCEDTVTHFERKPDTLVERLRAPDAKAQFAGEPEFQVAVELALDLGGGKFADADSAAGEFPQTRLEHVREYRLLEKLGEGGMGTVYKAQHTRLNRLVALKMLPACRMDHEPSIARFAREIEAVGKLDHPNIVRAFDAGEDDEVHYLVMELVDGVDLHRLVKQNGPLPIAEACAIVRQAALGLQHAHEHGLVHRDVKPSNLLLSRDGTVKVLDLGLALLQGESRRQEELTSTGQVMGTLDYIAPEQASDSHLVDVRADVYSLGCTLFKLLTGRAPFADSQHDSALKKLLAHAQDTPPALGELRADAPGELAETLQRMLAKDPDHRPATPADVAAVLEPAAAGADLPALAAQVNDLPPHDALAASADEIPVMIDNAGGGSAAVVTNDNDDRGPRAWLWFGWAAVATGCLCLGLTLASMTTVFDMNVLLTGGPVGLAQGISGSLRYMIVGVPALLVGIIVLILTYIRRW